MNDAACVVDRPAAVALLALIDGAPRTGAEVASATALDGADFRRLATALWTTKLLEGEVADGCCRDPCGIACICAMRMDRGWRLSRKGGSTLRRRGALPERTEDGR